MIERMEDLILTGMSVPLTPWTVVNADKLVPLLDRIRENMPEVIQKAQQVLEHRDDLLTEVQRKSGQMLQDAKEQAELMLSESELLRAVHLEAERVRHQVMTELEAMRKKAFEEAEAMKAQAYEEARATKEGSDQYAETILSSLDKSLLEFQAVVRNGQKHLKRSRAEAIHHAQQVAAQNTGSIPRARVSYTSTPNANNTASISAEDALYALQNHELVKSGNKGDL